MTCDGKCIRAPEQFRHPTGKPLEYVVSTAPAKKPWGEVWSAGTHHWRCSDCLASRGDKPKPPAPVTTTPVKAKKPKAQGPLTLEDILGS